MRGLAPVLVLLAACQGRPAGVTIAVAADGTLRVDGAAVTLDGLAAILAARGRAGPRETLDHGFEVSALPVRIDADDEAAWAHLAWVMAVLAEQKFWRLSLPGGREAPLPCDGGISPISPPPDGKALLASVLVLGGHGYMLGKRWTRDLAELGAWIDAAPRDGILCRIGLIAARPHVLWREVRPLFDMLRERGAKRIEFGWGNVPLPEARTRSPLPPPDNAPAPRRWGGLRVADYWSGPDRYELHEAEIDLPEEEDLLAWIDDHRSAGGHPALVADRSLADAAALHAQEMDRLGYFSHSSPVAANRSVSDRLRQAGWPVERRHAEMLAKADSPEAAFGSLLAHPDNAALLADPTLACAGFGRSGDLWVVILGAAR